MTAIAMHTGSVVAPTATDHPVGRARESAGARRLAGGLAMTISSITLLLAMLPGLAQVPSTDLEPRGLSAPTATPSTTVASSDRSLVIIETPVAGPHPAR
jgi:hypothetical protein